MATHPSANIRNFAVVGHASSGKTLLSEAMLACSGAIGRMGRIADGSTVSDYHVSERQRQISTQTSLLHTTWMEKKFNIMDTPGYLDFMSEALAALRLPAGESGSRVGIARFFAENLAVQSGGLERAVTDGADSVNAEAALSS